ncbi:xylulokinase [Janthinobacterium sp. Mn2066]|uniref:xylulokinase n=1 Tax=Janthinobacterium sp. Mn2066 TaxID=3395264 RepID=UPI003BD5047B
MHQELTLAIDVGTGSVRAALVDAKGSVLAIAAREHDQIVPAFGWSEQRPQDWWSGMVAAVQTVLQAVPGARERIAMVAACGQMHATVLVDADGALTRDTAPLWNDKRTVPLVTAYEAAHPGSDYLARTGNPPTPAWPAFKLQWLRDNDPDAYRRARAVLMPKDYLNLRLTGVTGMDRTEAACSFLMDPRTGDWSPQTCDELGLDIAKLATIRDPLAIVGHVTEQAALQTGLRAGTPVLVGAGDYPVGLLGSGVCSPGMGSEMLGTSCIVTVVTGQPLLDPAISNVGTVEGGWGAFMLLETGGDAMRWARRALHEKSLSYEDIVAKAALAPAGSDRLFFMPYLSGERFGRHRNARAQFFGIGAAHGLEHLHRAVLEGVAFGVKRHINIMEGIAGRKLERLVASGGGARTELWLRIKASVYGIPILVPKEAECGIIGCAVMAAVATGRHASLQAAAAALVSYEKEVLPDPHWAQTYARMQPVFEKLYAHSQAMYDDLDGLAP